MCIKENYTNVMGEKKIPAFLFIITTCSNKQWKQQENVNDFPHILIKFSYLQHGNQLWFGNANSVSVTTVYDINDCICVWIVTSPVRPKENSERENILLFERRQNKHVNLYARTWQWWRAVYMPTLPHPY